MKFIESRTAKKYRNCSRMPACLDFAALQEGKLSREGIRRLAGHVAKCDICKILFAFLLR